MGATSLFYLIIGILVFDFLLDKILDILNLSHLKGSLPEQLSDIYDQKEYKRSQSYEKETTRFGFLTGSIMLVVTLLFFFYDGFAFVDNIARNITDNTILIALLFFGILMFASDILGTPFSLYSVFRIEEKYGFNKTTGKTFVLDKIKGWIIGAILGGGILSLIIWFYTITQELFWVYGWIIVGGFMIFMTMFYTSIIVPLFNKLTPLEDGELKEAIVEYASSVGFELNNIYVIDGSKRSTKANAYFSGLGKKKKIVLFDTLIEKLSVDEIVAVLAHEVGHYKKKHTLSNILLGIFQTGVTFYIMSLFISNPLLSEALGVSQPSFHIGLITFGILYSPISTIVGLFMNVFSRKNEYQADNYAADTFKGQSLISALKTLSANNLSNLTPHPIYVFFNYSHPPLLSRIMNISKKS